jgi:Ca-activated chloride channel family protein
MTVLDGLHFIRPLWLLLLPFAVLLPWLWRRTRRPSGDWSRVCDPHLLRWLAVEQAASRRRRTGPWLAGTALLIAIVALAGPSWQRLPDSSWSARDARVIALDLSLSMMAEDLRPSRLTRARYRLADLLGSTEEGQVGLVTYAGDAYVVSPLSSDMNTIANLLPALRPDVIPGGGSRADRAP